MYFDHWKLRESPFRSAPDPRFFYQSPTHDEALARLDFLVHNRRRLALLVGDSGSGKTIVLQVFARQLKRQGHEAPLVNLRGLTPAEFPRVLAWEQGLNLPHDLPDFALWRAIADRAIENRYQQVSTVLLVDDADQASPDVLNYVGRLLEADPSPDSRTTVVLAASPSGLRQLPQRLLELSELRIDLEPWDEAITTDYLRASIERAGRTKPVFDATAAARLHELSQGVPRQINQLADLALLAGAGQQLKKIERRTVDSVFEELCVVDE